MSTARGTAVSLLAPTNGATLPRGSQVFLRSTAAIAGSIVSRVDYYLDGVPIPGASVSQAPYNVAYTVTAAPGAHTLFARAVASDGATVDSATVAFTVVTPVGVAPTVSLTAPASGAFVATGSSVSLTAVAADADGFISPNAGGGVTFFADGDPIGSDLVAPYATTWTPAVAKAYSLRAQTVDDKGNVTLSAPVTVTALAALPTVALVSPPSVATVGAPVTLTATANASPGASVTSVVFLANGTPIGVPALVSPYTVSWTPAASGAVSLTAQVTDSTGAVITSTAASVTVGSAAASVALIAPTTGSVVAVGTPIDVTATAAASAPGASVASVQFLAGASVIGTVTVPLGGVYSVKWTPTAGNTTLTARVTDTLGSTVTSTGVTVTGVAQTAVTLTAPASASTATLGVPFTLTASASATPGTVVTQVEFFAGATSLGVVPSAPFTLAWTPAAVGTFAIKARVTDSAGTTAETAAVNVTVGQSSSAFVAVTSPVPGAVVTVGVPTDVTATATAPTPGAIVSQVQFLAAGAVIGTVSVPVGGVYTVKWTPTAGNTTLTARVTDTLGGTATSSGVTVTGVVATSISLTAPANGATAVVGTAVNLTASAAATAGAIITKVDFFAGAVLVGTVNSAPFTLPWTPAAAGATALTARATDSFGSVVTSAAVNVTVNPAPPTIVITSPTPGNQLSAGEEIHLGDDRPG
ncbi:MAG: beta strand repeat-containing protein, partial [Verrucomicrobiota bacterium]